MARRRGKEEEGGNERKRRGREDWEKRRVRTEEERRKGRQERRTEETTGREHVRECNNTSELRFQDASQLSFFKMTLQGVFIIFIFFGLVLLS